MNFWQRLHRTRCTFSIPIDDNELNVAVPHDRPAIGPRLYLLFCLLTFLVFPLHELGHYLTYRAMGVELHMTLNTASPRDQSQRTAIAELAGPLVNLCLGSVAVFAYLRTTPRREWLAAAALSAALMRLVIYVAIIGATIVTGSALTIGNDEPVAAKLAGLPGLTFLILLTIPFVVIVVSVLRAFQGTRTRKAAHLTGLALTMMGLGVLIGNVLDPWLFPGG